MSVRSLATLVPVSPEVYEDFRVDIGPWIWSQILAGISLEMHFLLFGERYYLPHMELRIIEVGERAAFHRDQTDWDDDDDPWMEGL
jgi:hypothetical protein